MKFDDLYKIFKKDFGTDRLADISKELGVTPQVVSNWKSRNHVPYKYVRKLRELKKSLRRTSNRPYDDIDLKFRNDSKLEESEPIIQNLVMIYRKLLNKKKMLFASFITILIIVTLYLNFLYVPLYSSVGLIIPSSEQNSNAGVSNIASQFGLGGLSKGGGGTLSPRVFPNIIYSYNFLNSILNKSYNFKNFKNIKLINILLGADTKVLDWDSVSRLNAVEILSNKILVIPNRKTSIISLRVTTEDPSLSMKIAQNIIDELGITLKNYEKDQLNEKLDYITLRINEVNKELIIVEEKLKTFRETNRMIASSPLLILEEDRLSREVDVQVEIFTTLKTELELTQIELISRSNLIITIDRPRMPLYRANSSSMKIFIINIIIGLGISILFALAPDWYKEKIKNI